MSRPNQVATLYLSLSLSLSLRGHSIIWRELFINNDQGKATIKTSMHPMQRQVLRPTQVSKP